MTYWPISAPSVYAASKQKLPETCIATSDDGVRHPGQLQTHPGASCGDAQDEDPESTESSADPAPEDEDEDARQRQRRTDDDEKKSTYLVKLLEYASRGVGICSRQLHTLP
jgi:hypothetical protein